MSLMDNRKPPVAQVSPAWIMELSTAYWGSQTLFAANRLGLFELLAGAPQTAEQVASATEADLHRTRLLLKACVALGLVCETDQGYRNSPISDSYLVAGRSGYLGNAIRYCDDMYAPWGDLESSVRCGTPSMKAEVYLGGDPEKTRHFVHGMHDRALGIGRALVQMVDLTGFRRMLDVGGGPGTYSALFVKRYPGLNSTLLDLPPIVELASEILRSMNVQEAVAVLPGDFHKCAFPDGNDVVLCSGIFHRESEASCRELIRRAYRSLDHGGVLIVSDVFADPGGGSPAFSALFGLNMALSAPDGGVHADEDVASWMEHAGLGSVEVKAFPPPLPHRVVLGRKV